MNFEAELKKFELSSVFTINFLWLKRYVESDNGMYTPMKNISDDEFREIENSLYALQATWKAWREAKAQAVPEGFVLVPERNVHDHYIANHLKGTTCSVDVSELTGNDGDRIYGKLRSFDCLGSDGNTLIYDLESSNFNLVKTTGNTGDFVLVEKAKLMQIVGSAAIIEPITRGNPLMSKYKTELDFILSTVRAMIEAQEPAND